MKKVELLAPVGNMKCLKAAIEAGCDAVYLAGKLFGARSFAGNFNDEEMVEAINYSHLYGVKVYVTMNTIVYEREVDNFVNYARFLHKNNADAIIVQDIGMFDLLRKKFPNLELHASTQMNIHNYEGALLAKKLGFKRVVMARETSLEVIDKIKKEIDIEVEIFIHGALCVSYSGQCLLSALVGHRSGNRGTCAQICRKKYDLYDEEMNKVSKDKYLLSTKDLCTLQHLDKIIKTNVDSLKIEGRMKRPEYVYLVTSIYRKVIDNYYKTNKIIVDKTDIISLKKMFNRSFTKGFMLGEENNNFTNEKRPNHMGIKIGTVVSKKNGFLFIKLDDSVNIHDGFRIIDEKEDKGLVIDKMFLDNKPVLKAFKGNVIKVKYDKYAKAGQVVLLTTDSNQITEIQEELKKSKRKVLIDVKVEAFKNKPLIINITDGINKVIIKSKYKVEPSINKSVDEEFIKQRLNKTGNTIYKIRKIKILMDKNIFINIKEINDLRRLALENLNKKRLYKIPFQENDYYFNPVSFKNKKIKSVLINKKSEYEKFKNKVDLIYTENKSLVKKDVLYKLPRIIDCYEAVNGRVLIGEFGSILKYNEFDTDFSFNVTNSYSVQFLHEMGACFVTLSYELSIFQIKEIIESYKKRYGSEPNLSVIINSYPEALVSKYNLLTKYNLVNGYLKDEFNNKYKLENKNGYLVVFNYNKVNLYDEKQLYEIGVKNIRINL